MKAWQVDPYGHYNDVLSFNDVDQPAAGTVMRVEAAGINFADILSIAGKYQVKLPTPFIPGTEAAGEIIQTTDNSKFKVGDRIITMNMAGAFAEAMPVMENMSYKIPDQMTFEHAAAFLMTYQTSYFAVQHRANLQPGETLLVHAGAGGVGTAAIQLGKKLGATVIATAGSPEKLEICKQAGADHVINYREEDFVPVVKKITSGKGADVIYDSVGGDTFDKSTKVIAMEGRLLVIGFASGRIPEIAANRILLKNCSIVGLYWGNYQLQHGNLVEEKMEDLYGFYKEGAIEPIICKAYRLAELKDALTLLDSRGSYGKVIVKP